MRNFLKSGLILLRRAGIIASTEKDASLTRSEKRYAVYNVEPGTRVRMIVRNKLRRGHVMPKPKGQEHCQVVIINDETAVLVNQKDKGIRGYSIGDIQHFEVISD